MHQIPGIVDLRIQQAFDYPTLNVDVDRSKAALLGLTETDVASDLLVSLSGSSQTVLSYWIDPKTGTQYPVVAQTPQFRLALAHRPDHDTGHRRRRHAPRSCWRTWPPSAAA